MPLVQEHPVLWVRYDEKHRPGKLRVRGGGESVGHVILDGEVRDPRLPKPPAVYFGNNLGPLSRPVR
eukprot:5545794-Pyramimonas_sp.AAC.1